MVKKGLEIILYGVLAILVSAMALVVVYLVFEACQNWLIEHGYEDIAESMNPIRSALSYFNPSSWDVLWIFFGAIILILWYVINQCTGGRTQWDL